MRARRLNDAVVCLYQARAYACFAPHTKARIDAALRSAGGAVRHAEGMVTRLRRQ